MRFIHALVAFAALTAPAAAAGLDCTKAGTTVEREICARPDLRTLDGILATAYEIRYGQVSGAERHELADTQKDWAKSRERACANTRDPLASCIREWTEQRTYQLEEEGSEYVRLHALNGFCVKARTDMEMVICRNARLLKAEEEMTAAYGITRKYLAGEALADFVQSQKAWLASRENACRKHSHGVDARMKRDFINCVHGSTVQRILKFRDYDASVR